MHLLAIDPGNELSAYVLVNDELQPLKHEKTSNGAVLDIVRHGEYDRIAVEMIASYGMPVGREVFDTCRMIGRIEECAEQRGRAVSLIFRKDEKLNLCQSQKANDATIRRALIDRFARYDLKTGKGTKKNPDWFYGFAKDEWAAYAVAVTWRDMYEHRDR